MKKNNDPSSHNYFKPVTEFGQRMPQGSSWLVTVSHDSWCGVFKQCPCDCEPGIDGEPIHPEEEDGPSVVIIAHKGSPAALA